MPAAPRSGSWPRLRRNLRWCRRSFLLLLLAVVGGFVYLNQVGLPEFLKRPLVRELRARGVALEFSRLRWQWYRGLVAETVTLEGANQPAGPEVTFDEAAITINWLRLALLRFDVHALELRRGRVVVPLTMTSEPARRFVADQIAAELDFLPDGRWELKRFAAACLGTRLAVTGTLTNAKALRDWGGQPEETGRSLGVWQHHLLQASRVAEALRFRQPPELHVEVLGDARDPASLQARLRFQAVDAETAWGAFDRWQVHGRLNQPTGTHQVGASDLTIEVDRVRTPWTEVGQGRLRLAWVQAVTNLLPAEVLWHVDLQELRSPWGESPRIQFDLLARPSAEPPSQLVGTMVVTSDRVLGALARAETNRVNARVVLDGETFLPVRADWELHAAKLESAHGTARELRLSGAVVRRRESPDPPAAPDWGWWAGLAPFDLSWEGEVVGLAIQELAVDRLNLVGHWTAPRLRLDSLRGELRGRQLEAAAELDVGTRVASARTRFDCDVHDLASLLPPQAARWLAQFAWDEPPSVAGTFGLILPAWTNRPPHWEETVVPSVWLAGSLSGRRVTFRGVTAESVEATIQLTNRVWHLPSLTIQRPEGSLELGYTEDARTRDYHCRVRGQIDPEVLRPALDAEAERVLDQFQFAAPLRLQGEVWGRWQAPERLGAHGQLEAAHFVVRGEPVDELTATIHLTNAHLAAVNVRVRTGDELVAAPGVGFDLREQRLRFTNAIAQLDPLRIPRAIGPKTAQILEPFRFLRPPRARVDGWVNVADTRQADLHFDVAGGPFHYWRFSLPEVRGTVHWVNETLVVSNLHGAFYQGSLDAEFHVDLTKGEHSWIDFTSRFAQVDFHQFMADTYAASNRLEGTLSGELIVTKADTRDWLSWQGYGRAELREGFLWDIPLFGALSPALNAVVPRLGMSRVSGAAMHYTITNSVVHTDDLELRSPWFRLAYRGAADFKGNVNARVEARLLRDAWLIGPVVSLALTPVSKLFEYQVRGTLARPEMELVYIPKPFQLPFAPFKILREMFAPGKAPAPPPAAREPSP
jgi:hypothetical protein